MGESLVNFPRFGVRRGADTQVQAGLAEEPVQGDEVHRGRDEADLPGLQGAVPHGGRQRGELQDHILTVLPARRSV